MRAKLVDQLLAGSIPRPVGHVPTRRSLVRERYWLASAVRMGVGTQDVGQDDGVAGVGFAAADGRMSGRRWSGGLDGRRRRRR
jgi:hypothetical protein